jgi:predicted small integral membrane protein
MARKTSKEYRKEYQDLTKKRNAIEARIIKRALTMRKSFPDAIIDYLNVDNTPIYAIDYEERIIEHMTVDVLLQFLLKIETFNEKQSNFVQTSMFEDEFNGSRTKKT